MLSVSGAPDLLIHDTTNGNFTLSQSIPQAHRLGAHHLCASGDGKTAASAGFGGELKIWFVTEETGEWKLAKEIREPPGEVWAIALSENGQFLASTTHDGRINIWNIEGNTSQKIQQYETGGAGGGSFGTSVDLSSDGKYTASGHEHGDVFVFDNDSGRLKCCLSGQFQIAGY